MVSPQVQQLNPVFLDEANVADVNLSAPTNLGRWKAVHNLHGTALNILAPSNEIYKYTAEDASARSNFFAPTNSGKLDEDQSILSSATSVETSATGSFSSKTNVAGSTTVTRNGVDVTAAVTKPTFDGINYNGTALTAIVVNGEGADLEQGDVISFPVTDNTGLTVTITVGEDDLQLGAGLNILKAETMAVAAVIPANHLVQLPSFSKIQIQATDGGNDATAVCYWG